MNTMKYAFILIIILSISCKFKDGKSKDLVKQDKLKTVMVFRDTIVNLEKVREGIKIPFSFVFSNQGEFPLIISKVESNCGCTVIDNKSPKTIAPHHTDSLTGFLNTSGIKGVMERKIFVLANTKKNFYILTINANVQ